MDRDKLRQLGLAAAKGHKFLLVAHPEMRPVIEEWLVAERLPNVTFRFPSFIPPSTHFYIFDLTELGVEDYAEWLRDLGGP